MATSECGKKEEALAAVSLFRPANVRQIAEQLERTTLSPQVDPSATQSGEMRRRWVRTKFAKRCRVSLFAERL